MSVAIYKGQEVSVILTDAETGEALIANPDNVDTTLVVSFDDLIWIVR